MPAAQLGSPVQVSSTAPSRLLTDFMNMTDHKSINAAYGRHCKDIRRYLAFDIALLAKLEANPRASLADRKAIVEKKKKMLIQYQELRGVETLIPNFGGLCFILYLIGNDIELGFLFSAGITWLSAVRGDVSLPAWFYYAFFFVRRIAALRLWHLGVKIYSIFEEEENEANGVEGWSGGTVDVSSTAVELAKLVTRRRTATGLVEEGRSPAGS